MGSLGLCLRNRRCRTEKAAWPKSGPRSLGTRPWMPPNADKPQRTRMSWAGKDVRSQSHVPVLEVLLALGGGKSHQAGSGCCQADDPGKSSRDRLSVRGPGNPPAGLAHEEPPFRPQPRKMSTSQARTGVVVVWEKAPPPFGAPAVGHIDHLVSVRTSSAATAAGRRLRKSHERPPHLAPRGVTSQPIDSGLSANEAWRMPKGRTRGVSQAQRIQPAPLPSILCWAAAPGGGTSLGS